MVVGKVGGKEVGRAVHVPGVAPPGACSWQASGKVAARTSRNRLGRKVAGPGKGMWRGRNQEGRSRKPRSQVQLLQL